ncbi:MAG: SDR family NAD(P)-dependent oxidoreductase [Halioglobus sp.]
MRTSTEVTADSWRASVETALISPIEIVRHYIPTMKQRGWGRIVNIATFSARTR